jgi:arylsulfatase A-like enzyme
LRNPPLRAAKGTFYEGGIRVPMIARLPGVTKAGETTGTMVNVVDLYPTFAEFAGAKLPDPAVHALDGQSFATVIRGEAKESKRDVTYYHFPGYLDTRAFPESVIIKRVEGKEYKLIYSYEDKHFEMYDESDDVSEKHDLLQGKVTDENKKVAANLRDDLRAWLEGNHPLMAKVPATGEFVPMPITVEEALKAGNVIKREAKATKGGEGAGEE